MLCYVFCWKDFVDFFSIYFKLELYVVRCRCLVVGCYDVGLLLEFCEVFICYIFFVESNVMDRKFLG